MSDYNNNNTPPPQKSGGGGATMAFIVGGLVVAVGIIAMEVEREAEDRKSTRLNSSHAR